MKEHFTQWEFEKKTKSLFIVLLTASEVFTEIYYSL